MSDKKLYPNQGKKAHQKPHIVSQTPFHKEKTVFSQKILFEENISVKKEKRPDKGIENPEKEKKKENQVLEFVQHDENYTKTKKFSAHSLISYKIVGSKIKKFTSENNLQMIRVQLQKQEEEEKRREMEKREIKESITRRYFDFQGNRKNLRNSNVCFKCQKKGHLARHCLQKFFACRFCLGNHDESDCEEEVNKMYEENNYKRQVRGKHAGGDGGILFLKSKEDFRQRIKKEGKKVKCLNCMKECGKFNCFVSSSKAVNIYKSKN